MLKIGIIGCGHIAMSYHGPALKKYCGEQNAAIVGCCDTDLSRAKEFGETFGCDAHFDNYQEMLDKTKPDAVCIYVSYQAIPSMAIDIMNQGYPVLMEKPPGDTGADVQSIINAAANTKTFNMVAFNRRHAPILGELKKMVDDKDMHNIRCVFQRVNRRDTVFHTTAIHGIDTVRYIAGCDYKHINFRYQELPEVSDGAANIYMDCLMESGVTAQLAFWQCGGASVEEYHVTCRDNEYALKMPLWNSYGYPGSLTHLSRSKQVSFLPGDSPQFGADIFMQFGFYNENAMFFDAVRGEKMHDALHGIESALQAVVVGECIKGRLLEYRV